MSRVISHAVAFGLGALVAQGWPGASRSTAPTYPDAIDVDGTTYAVGGRPPDGQPSPMLRLTYGADTYLVTAQVTSTNPPRRP